MAKIKNLKGQYLVLLLFISILLLACGAAQEQTEIRSLIDQIYTTKNPYRNNELNENVFSKSLYALIAHAKSVENLSIEGIPESERSNIKPHLIEGEIFASLYDGYTSFEIGKIMEKGDSAVVEIAFTYQFLGANEVWTDELGLIKENGWKLDTVNYDETISMAKDIRQLLTDFIHYK